jgi:hypothetical protein
MQGKVHTIPKKLRTTKNDQKEKKEVMRRKSEGPPGIRRRS